MIRLLIATNNAHKVGEIQGILGSRFACRPLKDFPGAPAVIEDAGSFAGNATKKAQAIANWLSQSTAGPIDYVLADDSGLEVDALEGAPGVHSARFAALEAGAKGNATDGDNNAKLLRLLRDIPSDQRTARFRCVIALVRLGEKRFRVGQKVALFDGTCEGHIELQPAGRGGFGYDPLFIPTGFAQTFAELGAEVKNRLSHRAKALNQLKTHFDRTPAR